MSLRVCDLPLATMASHHTQESCGKESRWHIKIRIRPREELQPSIKSLWHLIEHNTDISSLFTQMLEQVPNSPPYDRNPTNGYQFRNWMDLLYAFNDQLSQGPVWLYGTPGQQGLIGFPFNALLVRYGKLTRPSGPTPIPVPVLSLWQFQAFVAL